jgi:hypothetical protein
MKENPVLNPVDEILASIRKSLSNAEHYSDDDDEQYVAYLIESAFIKVRILLEAANLPEALKAVQEMEAQAKQNYADTALSRETGEMYLVWGAALGTYLDALELILGDTEARTVSKHVVEILRATQYSITDRKCFLEPPKDEKEVHVRIEAVLRCIFPDLIHKPRITKQIKQFEPDTGLPSIRTLIEYKFIASAEEAKRVAGEVLSDTRGYLSKEWDQFIYVIYETKRIRPEKQWNQLLRASDVGSNSSIIVIHGEEPSKQRPLLRKSAGAAS